MCHRQGFRAAVVVGLMWLVWGGHAIRATDTGTSTTQPDLIARYPAGSVLGVLCVTAKVPEVYILLRNPKSKGLELRQASRLEKGWTVPTELGEVNLPFPLASESGCAFAVLQHSKAPVLLYTAQARGSKAGIAIYAEYPFLAVAGVLPKGASGAAIGTLAEVARNLEMRRYGPMCLADACSLGETRWLVLSRSGYVFDALEMDHVAAGATTQPSGLPSTTGYGIRVQMRGRLGGITDMKPMDAALPVGRENIPDGSRCHGFGRPSGATVTVLCSRSNRDAMRGNARILEVHSIKHGIAGAMSASVLAKTEMAAEASSLVVLDLDSSLEGELWWCGAQKALDGQGLLIGRCGSRGRISWQDGISAVDGTLAGGFVDQAGSVSVVLLRTKGEQVEVGEMPLGRFTPSRWDSHGEPQD